MSDGTATGDHGEVDGPGVGDVGVDPADLLPFLGIGVCYLVTVLGGLALADEMSAMGLVLFRNPADVGNVGVFGLYVLGFTAVFLLAVRYDLGMALLRLFMVVAFGSIVATSVVAVTGVGSVIRGNAALMGLPSSPLSLAVAAVTALALWVYPEWYVIDVVAVVGGAAAIPMLGLGFGPLPIVVLLVVWAAYDAYAVYVSGHMKDVAEGAGAMKLPIVFVVPTRRGFSYRELEGLGMGGGSDGEGPDDEAGSTSVGDEDVEGEELPAMMLGLGDALIPGMLAVSAGEFLPAPTVVPALNANLPAIGALLGGIAGMAALLYLVHRVEGVHAGLPPLNAGVLAGYLVGALAADVPLAVAVGL